MEIDRDKIDLVKLALKSAYFGTRMRGYSNDVDWSDAYIAGGAIASLLQGEPPKDFDVYFRRGENASPFSLLRACLITNHNDDILDVDLEYREVLGENGKMITENAVTMKDGFSFIFMHTGEPEEMKKTFDYLHCCAHYDIIANKLHISPRVYDAIMNKKLIVNNPERVLEHRTTKFLKRGYTI